MTLRDGKLITLTNHVTVSADKQSQFPLDHLPFYFPIPPTGEIKRSSQPNHNEKQVVRRGTVSQFGGPGLETITWEGELIVGEWYGDEDAISAAASMSGNLILDPQGNVITLPSGNFARTPIDNSDPFSSFPSYFLRPPRGFKFYSAVFAYKILAAIRDQGLVVNLRIQDLNTGQVETDMPCTLRLMDFTEKPGEPDHRFYSIGFSQYRWLKIREVDRAGGGAAGGTPRPTAGRFVSSPYTTAKAMNIKELSQLAYHNNSKGDAIITANGGSKKMHADKKLNPIGSPTAKTGAWTVPKGVSIVIPPLAKSPGTIAVVPAGTKPPTPA